MAINFSSTIIRPAAGTGVPTCPQGTVFGMQAHQGFYDFILGNEADPFQAKEEGYLWGWEQGALYDSAA